MEYNKRQIAKLRDKKILHKIRKRWVVISVAVLGIFGGAAAVSEPAGASVHPASASSAGLQTSSVSASSLEISGRAASSAALSRQRPVSQQADQLYQRIMTHAMASSDARPRSSVVSSPLMTAAKTEAVPRASSRTPRVHFEKWGTAQIKFVSDGDHGQNGGDLAEVEPGQISDAFNEQNNSDATYKSDQGAYLVNRYSDALTLPFDASDNNWRLKFAPGTKLAQNGGASKGDQTPQPGEDPDDVDYSDQAFRTNDYRYLLSSTNRPLWNHFKVMDLANLDTNAASDLSNLFFGDRSLEKIVLNSDENPQLSDMQGMFADDPQLQEIDFNHFNTSHVKNMDSLFMSDYKLDHLDLSTLDTQRVANMHAMFMSDAALSDIKGLNQLATGQVNNLISAFANDASLRDLDLGSWDTGRVQSMAGLFAGDRNLRSLDLNGWQTGQVSDMSSMFSQDSQLRELNLGSFDTRGVRGFPGIMFGGMSQMFTGDDQLDELTIGPLTDLDRPNQDWNAEFFKRNYDINGNDTTQSVKRGVPGTYYSADYYNNFLLYHLYFSDEEKIMEQLQSDPQVRWDAPLSAQVSQSASQVARLVDDAGDKPVNSADRNRVLNDVSNVDRLVKAASQQTSAADDLPQAASAARSADQSIAASYQASVSRSVSIGNSRAAQQAARSADQSIANSYRDSVAASVQNTDHSIADSYQQSVADSVARSNHRTASAAARSADDQIRASAAASVSNSVSALDSRVAESAAHSADQSIAASCRDSVIDSVSAMNSRVAASLAHQSSSSSADQKSVHGADGMEFASLNNDINAINNYDQSAEDYDEGASNDLDRLNVGSNASLNSFKDADLSEVADDGTMINEDREVTSSLADLYSENDLDWGSVFNNADDQIRTASNIAQDASLIITDDVMPLESQANAADDRANSASNSRNSDSSSSDQDVMKALDQDRTDVQFYLGNVERDAKNPLLIASVQPALDNNLQIAAQANSAVANDQLHPSRTTEADADQACSRAGSVSANADQLINVSIRARDHQTPDHSRPQPGSQPASLTPQGPSIPNNNSLSSASSFSPASSSSSNTDDNDRSLNNIPMNSVSPNRVSQSQSSQNSGSNSRAADRSQLVSRGVNRDDDSEPQRPDTSSLPQTSSHNDPERTVNDGSDHTMNDATSAEPQRNSGSQSSASENSSVQNNQLPQTGDARAPKGAAMALLTLGLELGGISAGLDRKRKYRL